MTICFTADQEEVIQKLTGNYQKKVAKTTGFQYSVAIYVITAHVDIKNKVRDRISMRTENNCID